MDIETARQYALSLHPAVTEELFVKSWVSWRIGGKWFMLTNLDVPEPAVAVKIEPERALALQEHYDGVRPAYHMNKRHWYDLVLGRLDEHLVEELIAESFRTVSRRLPMRTKAELGLGTSTDRP